jgi:hypothetical protein
MRPAWHPATIFFSIPSPCRSNHLSYGPSAMGIGKSAVSVAVPRLDAADFVALKTVPGDFEQKNLFFREVLGALVTFRTR